MSKYDSNYINNLIRLKSNDGNVIDIYSIYMVYYL